jgi:hypothetical protein
MWDKTFDFVLYPLAIIHYGLVWGTAMMMTASFVICITLIQLYDRLSASHFRDLLGFESIKEAAAAVTHSRFATRLHFSTKKIPPPLVKLVFFVYLSVWFDPMTCTIFMRPADHYSMSAQYWFLFALSVLISNCVWAALVYFGVESVHEILEIML